MAKETNIDCMKHRKSTHLAGVDVETMRAEKNGPLILTIREAYYNTGVEVSGNKTNGYFIEFVEKDVKPMVLNSGNRKVIASIVKEATKCESTESRNIANWLGHKIELIFDPSVKMMGQVVGGIKVVPPVIVEVSDIDPLAIIRASNTVAELQANWAQLSLEEKKLPTVLAEKEKLKGELK